MITSTNRYYSVLTEKCIKRGENRNKLACIPNETVTLIDWTRVKNHSSNNGL